MVVGITDIEMSDEFYKHRNICFGVVNDGIKTHVYVVTGLQSFRLIVSNSNGYVTYRKIIKNIRSGRTRDFNGLIGQFGKSIQMQSCHPKRTLSVQWK